MMGIKQRLDALDDRAIERMAEATHPGMARWNLVIPLVMIPSLGAWRWIFSGDPSMFIGASLGSLVMLAVLLPIYRR